MLTTLHIQNFARVRTLQNALPLWCNEDDAAAAADDDDDDDNDDDEVMYR